MEINKLLELEYDDFLNELKNFSKTVQLELLKNNDIRDKIFLLNTNLSPWNFEKVFSIYSLLELTSIMSSSFITQLEEQMPEQEYVYLVLMKRNNEREFENLLRKYDWLLDLLLFHGSSIGRELVFDYDVILSMIDYMEKENIHIENTCLFEILFVSLKDKNLQMKYLEEEIPIEYKKRVFMVFDEDLITEYIKKNNVFLTDKEIYDLMVYSNVSLDPSFYEREEFFQKKILSASLFEMRQKINRLSRNHDVSYLEKLLEKLEKSILKSYQVETEQFIYASGTELYELFLSFHFDDLETSFKRETKKVLFQVIIDRLFHDTIHNVFLDIEELLQFNKKLNLSFLTLEKARFYEEILNLFDQTPKGIYEFYLKYKDKKFKIIETFYEDIRKAKEIAYQMLKSRCFDFSVHKELKDKELSKKYQREIYRLFNVPFSMLVSCRRIVYDNEMSRAARNCYSFIGDRNMKVFIEDDIIYGYLDFDIQNIMHVYENDSYSQNHSFKTTNLINRIRTPDEILSSKKMNEIQIKNNLLETNDLERPLYKRIVPSYIVCFDIISEKSLDAANKLNLPIVLIDRKSYKTVDEPKILENHQEEYTTSPINEYSYQDKVI